ncbi:MAG: PfkB family carbohydrate kinase [Syntrophales bacterium]|nr:PfkB family carbohydrate kinase [Syntrophales bacterium]
MSGCVFGLGQCSLDYIGLISSYPPPDVKCEFTNLHIEGGGPVATAMVALTRWGIPCSFTGVVGDDDFGSLILRDLAEEGVDVSRVVVRKGCYSQFAFIVAEPSNGRRTIFWQRPTGESIKPEELDLEKLKRSRMLYTDGLFVEASLFACRQAKKWGVTVFVDAGTLREGMLEMATLSDCFIVSEVFSRSLAESPRKTCEYLANLGCPFVGVTLGAEGYIALVDGQWIEGTAYKVQTVDTTGCGDVFHAGVAWGLLKGWPPGQCLDLGAWAAAMVSTKLGGRKGIPPLAELKMRYGT